MMNARREKDNATPERNTASHGVAPIDDDLPKSELDAAAEHAKERDPDELPNIEAEREALRQHNDAFIVEADLEDADQREASPGTREQP